MVPVRQPVPRHATRRPEELIPDVWLALDRKPQCPPDRWYMRLHNLLAGPNVSQRSTDDLLATLDGTESAIAWMRHLPEIGVVQTLITWGELDLAEQQLDELAPGWIDSGSAAGRTCALTAHAALHAARGRWDETARLLDEALQPRPVAEWHWSECLFADTRLLARVYAGWSIRPHDLTEPWLARQSSGLDVANPRAALATAFALDRLGEQRLAEEFERLLAASSPDQIASDRAALRIPEDYDLDRAVWACRAVGRSARPAP